MARLPVSIVVTLALTACGDPPPDSGSTESSGIPTITASSGDTGDTTGGSTGAGTADGTTEGPELPCSTVLCGPEAVCCPEGEECAAGNCLPACASGVRCGPAQDVCCEAGQVCLSDECVTPTGACVDSFDCDFGQFCEPTLDQCLPQSDPVLCELEPQFEEIDATEEWSFSTDEVISSPVVADLDGDGTPEVIVNTTQQDGLSWPGGVIVVLDGASGAELWRLPHDPGGAGTYGSHGRSSAGVGDVSGDGLPDIVYAGRAAGGSLIHAVDGQGNLLWSSHDAAGADYRFNVENGGPSLANLDDDPEAEIVFGAAVLDHDGLVVWDEGGNGAVFGTNNSYTGGLSALVDLVGDSTPEIVSGRHAWSIDWQDGGGVPMVTVSPLWDAGGSDGYPAIADLDQDGTMDEALLFTKDGAVVGTSGEPDIWWPVVYFEQRWEVRGYDDYAYMPWSGEIEDAWDRDYFVLEIPATWHARRVSNQSIDPIAPASKYRIRVESASTGTPLADPRMWVYTLDGAHQIAENDDINYPSDLQPQVEITTQAWDQHVAVIVGGYGSHAGDYEVIVEPVT